MPSFEFQGVNDAFFHLVKELERSHIKRCSRAGDVIMFEDPVLVKYLNPMDRVLFCKERDANPFFHLYEALWMLAGRNDVASLAYYNSQISDVASDDGITFNGAYGHRWRHGRTQIRDDELMKRIGVPSFMVNDFPGVYCVDQLKIIIDQLKRKPESRRCVLSMWNVEDDLMKIDVTKDVCCNTHVYFSLDHGNQYLDMTVCNRSNDLIWGMLGANMVHFSFLQEYMAAQIGVKLGYYHQFTNNLHAYTSRWEPGKWLSDPSEFPSDTVVEVPLVESPARFDDELPAFVSDVEGDFKEPFIKHVAQEMCLAFRHHKDREYDKALEAVERVKADRWRIVGKGWLERRRDRWVRRYA